MIKQSLQNKLQEIWAEKPKITRVYCWWHR